MKVCVSSKALCISLILLLVGNKSAVSGDDLDALRDLLTGPLAYAVPGLGGNLISFLAVVLSVSADEQASTNDIKAELATVHITVDRIEALVKGQQEGIPSRTDKLGDIRSTEQQITDFVNKIHIKFRDWPLHMSDRDLREDDAGSHISTAGLKGEVNQLNMLLNPAGGKNILEKYYDEISRKVITIPIQ